MNAQALFVSSEKIFLVNQVYVLIFAAREEAAPATSVGSQRGGRPGARA